MTLKILNDKRLTSFIARLRQKTIAEDTEKMQQNPKSTWRFFTEKLPQTFRGDARRTQLETISADLSQVNPKNKRATNESMRKIYGNADRKFQLISAALGLTTLGFFYTPFCLLSTPLILYSILDYVQKGYTQLTKNKKVSIDLLVSVMISTGVLMAFTQPIVMMPFYLFLANLNSFMARLNQRITSNVRNNAESDIVDVFRDQRSSVWVLSNGVEIEIPVSQLKKDDIVITNAGETIPVDGFIVEGQAIVDQHVLTGEAQPIERGPGEYVYALTLVLTGKLHIVVEKSGSETTVAQIGEILNNTTNVKLEMQLWFEEVADRSVLPLLLISAASVPLLGIPSAWAVLVAHPKYRTTIIGYLTILSYLRIFSERGILIKDGAILDILKDIDVVIFDKTGTLTEEQPHVHQIYTYQEYTSDQVLAYAAAAEYKQTHPIAKAILDEAVIKQIEVPEVDEVSYKISHGLSVRIENKLIRVGSLRFIEGEGIAKPSKLDETQRQSYEQGNSLVFVALDESLIGAIELQPTVRPDAKATIENLRQHGIHSTYIISGDHEIPTRKLANDLGIDHYFAETLPEEKANLIAKLQSQGKKVCYIGDGINDAIALKKADVSVSLRGATTVAVDTAQVILMDQSLAKLDTLFDLGTKFDQDMKRSITAAVGPSALLLVGILFFHFSATAAILLSASAILAGLISATNPTGDDDVKQLPSNT